MTRPLEVAGRRSISAAQPSLCGCQVCKLTGNDEYVAGDLSTEIDARVKAAAAKCAAPALIPP